MPAAVRERLRRGDRSAEREEWWSEDTPLRFAVLIDRPFLRDPSGIGAEASFGWWSADTPADARRTLIRMALPGIISPPQRSPRKGAAA